MWNSISIVRPSQWIDKIDILAMYRVRHIEYLVHTIHRRKLYLYVWPPKQKFAFLPYHSLLINGIYIISRVHPPFRELLTFIFRFVPLYYFYWFNVVHLQCISFPLFTFVIVGFFFGRTQTHSMTVIDRVVYVASNRLLSIFLVARFEIGIPAMFMTCVMPP